MRMTYDREADAAYIYVKDKIAAGEVKKTISLDEDFNLDFDKDMKLLGIEVLGASEHIASSVLRKQAVTA